MKALTQKNINSIPVKHEDIIYVMKFSLMSSDNINHPSFGLSNILTELEYSFLTDEQKTYYSKVLD